MRIQWGRKPAPIPCHTTDMHFTTLTRTEMRLELAAARFCAGWGSKEAFAAADEFLAIAAAKEGTDGTETS